MTVLPALPAAIARVEAMVFRCPLESPVRTSFGVMRERPALFVRVTDADGARGFGEVWCNFPAVGAEHRARLLVTVLAPLVEGTSFASPADAFAAMTGATAVLALQSGEPGPLAQCIAGLDIALWDLAARRVGEPLWRLLGGRSPVVRVYASGINPDAPERVAERLLAAGHRAFKLKVGFGAEDDIANLGAMRRLVGDCPLMVDANQAWDVAAATVMAERLAEHRPAWLEEPLRADRPWSEWRELARASPVPLAGGENIQGEEAFASAVASGALSVVQPDLAKWGGFSGCLPVARRILGAGLRFCPHYLGGGIGLLASAHLLVAAGGDGLLELDANPNPLRSVLAGPLVDVTDGACTLGDTPGLGEPPSLDALSRYVVPIPRLAGWSI